jgi:pimeloyl-ACP methyl ester carboxylesterase
MRALEREQGPFHAIIAHSLGAAASALALDAGLAARRVVFLGPAANPPRWASAFAARLGLTDPVVARMRARSERRLGLSWAELDVPRRAARRAEPLLVLHDRQDAEVPMADGRLIAASWPGARFVATLGLGHQRLLRDASVIREAVAFAADGVPERCSCGAATADSCEACRLERQLFDRESRWAGPRGASIGSWASSSSVLPSTSAP